MLPQWKGKQNGRPASRGHRDKWDTRSYLRLLCFLLRWSAAHAQHVPFLAPLLWLRMDEQLVTHWKVFNHGAIGKGNLFKIMIRGLKVRRSANVTRQLWQGDIGDKCCVLLSSWQSLESPLFYQYATVPYDMAFLIQLPHMLTPRYV